MTNTNKARGTAFETAVVNYLREHGYPDAERRALHGKHDRGDLIGVPWAVECKNHSRLDLAGWVAQARAEAVNAGAPVGVVVHKARGRGVADSYVTLTLADFVRLMEGT